MIRLDLSTDEQYALYCILQNNLAELRSEINHTDSSLFRDALRKRKQVLLKVIEALRLQGVGEKSFA